MAQLWLSYGYGQVMASLSQRVLHVEHQPRYYNDLYFNSQ